MNEPQPARPSKRPQSSTAEVESCPAEPDCTHKQQELHSGHRKENRPPDASKASSASPREVSAGPAQEHLQAGSSRAAQDSQRAVPSISQLAEHGRVNAILRYNPDCAADSISVGEVTSQGEPVVTKTAIAF